MKERIHKIIANCGICSRRAAEDLIEKGKVLVNGEKAKIGQSADIEVDKILVGGKMLKKPVKQYYILNKPEGYETTMNSPQKRRTILSLIKAKERVVPVGRLDMNSQGLLILTNDGEFANRVMHPKYELEKTYEATVKGLIPKKKLDILERGVKIKTGMTYPCKIRILKQGKKFMKVSVKIHEGKNRQIREMFKAIGYKVEDLKRTHIAFLSLKGLKEGKSRKLTSAEVASLKKLMETPNKKPKFAVKERMRDNREWKERKKLSDRPPQNSKYKDYKNPKHKTARKISSYDRNEDKRSLSNDWDGKTRAPIKRVYSKEGTPPRRSSYRNKSESRGSYSRDRDEVKPFSKTRSSGYGRTVNVGREKRSFSREGGTITPVKKSYARSGAGKKAYSRNGYRTARSKSRDSSRSSSSRGPRRYVPKDDDIIPFDPTRKPKERFKDRLRKEKERKGSRSSNKK